MWQDCSEQSRIRDVVRIVNIRMHIRLRKVPTYSTLDRNLVRICKILKSAEIDKSGTFREKSRFWRFWRFLAQTRILAGFQPGSQIRPDLAKPPVWPGLARSAVRTCQAAGPGQIGGLARSGRIGCPDLPGGWPAGPPVWPGLARPAETCQEAVRTAETCSQGAIYRPLSIATSVENDWARGGPFSGSPLTLALETIEF